MLPASADGAESAVPGATPPRHVRSTMTMLRLLLAALICLGAAAPAHASIELGVQDDPVIVRLPTAFGGFGADRLMPPTRVDAALDRLGVDTVRINVPWA